MNLLMMFASFLGIGYFGSGCGSGTCTIASNILETSGQEVGVGFATLGGNKIAQSFYVTSTATLKSIQLKLAKVGTITTSSGYTVTVTIVNDSSNQPGSTTLSSTMTMLTDNISSTPTLYAFTPTEFSISPGTYWIKLVVNYPVSASNYIKATAHEGSSGEYTLGQAVYENGSAAWSTSIIGGFRDLVFAIGC
jgi:hypothetical protein